MNIMYYCIISFIFFIILLILTNIAFDDEELSRYDEPFIIQAIAFCVAALWPLTLIFLAFVSFIYFTNLAVKNLLR